MMQGYLTYHPTSLGLVASGKRKIKSGSEYDRLFPAAKGASVISNPNGDVYQTLDYMQDIVSRTLYQTKAIAKVLSAKSLEQTCRNIFDFCYTHIQYKLDDAGFEQLRQPSRTWKDRKTGVDCDCFSIFISSILTNLGIPHHLRIVELHNKGYFQHVYVIADTSGKNYITIDPVLDTFNKEAPGITKIHDKTMGIPIQELSGADAARIELGCARCGENLGCGQCGGGCTACGTSAKRAAPQSIAPTAAQINSMELKMLRPIYDQLVASKAQIQRNPSSVRALYKPEQMVETIDYALSNWSDKTQRDKALEVLASQDDKLLSDYMPKTVTAMQGLLGLSDAETMGMLGLGYYPDSLGNVSLGGFWTSVKSAAKSVGHYAGTTASKAWTGVKQGAKFVGTKAVVATKAVKQASVWTASKVAQGAKFVGKQVMKYNPLSLAGRNSFLFLVRINFRGWATGLKKAADNPTGAKKLKDKWESTLISGQYSALKSAIDAGAKRHRLMGLDGTGLGEPVTVGTAIASASGIIAAITPLIDMFKSKGDNVDTSSALPTDPAQVNYSDPSAAIQSEASSSTPALTPTSKLNPVDPKKSSSGSGLLIAGVAVAAIALIASHNVKSKTLSGADDSKNISSADRTRTIKVQL